MGKHSSDKDRKKEKKAKKAKKKSQREKHKEKKTDHKNEKIPVPYANSTTSAPEATPQVQVAVTVPLATNLGGDNDASDKAGTAASGWSWGEAFSAAAEIRPNDDDLDEDFLRRTATAAGDGDGNGDDFNQQGGNSGLAAIASMIGNPNTSSSHPEISEPAMPESTALGIDTEPTTPTVEESETETAHESKKDKKKKKKSKKKDKKKKRKKNSADDTSSDDGSNSKHKSKKRRRSSEEDDDPDPTSDSDGAAALEGRMVPSDPDDPSSELIIVLVDVASGIVYSGMDRTESGDRVQVGKLVNGQVVLDPKSISRSESDQGEVIYCSVCSPKRPFPQSNKDVLIQLRMFRSRCSCSIEDCAIIAHILSHGVPFGQKSCNISLGVEGRV